MHKRISRKWFVVVMAGVVSAGGFVPTTVIGATLKKNRGRVAI